MTDKNLQTNILNWSLKDCNDYLVQARKQGLRNSELITLIANKILKSNPNFSKIQDKHATLEQCVLAAIDDNDISAATKLFKLLEVDFPKEKSKRTDKLHLIFCEIKRENLASLKEERKELLEKFDTDQQLLKRQAAIEASENNLDKAIFYMVEYLSIFQCDDDGWMFLADLYIDLGYYSRAAFCLEEIVMKNPHTAHYHIRLAEIYYTWASLEPRNKETNSKESTLDNFENCKFHYAHAIRLTLNSSVPNLRAFFGWMQASKQVNSLRNLKNVDDSKRINVENLTMSYMCKQLSKHNFEELKQGKSVGSYLEGLLKNLNLDVA